MGSLVGQTEGNIRQALKIADAVAPCVLFLDELEKALAGVASSGHTDSGVSARLFGTFLSWLNDHTSVVPVAVTASESVKRLRDWASGRCLDADQPGIYNPRGTASGKPRRGIPRDPSVN